MKKSFLIILVLAALAVTACGTQPTPAPIPTVSIDPASSNGSSSGTFNASAVVVPITTVKLSFPISGIVKTVEVAEGDSVTAGQPLVTLETSILEARVAEAEANVVTVQTQLAYLIRTGTSQERLDAAQANIDRAQTAVDIAKSQLAFATLTAPFDGIIASVDIAPSEFAGPGQIVIIMGDLQHFQIETTDLSETDIPFIQPGQTAVIYIEALNQEFTGKVVDIARISETIGGDVVFKTTVAFDEQPEGLRWGMSAEVKIETK